MSASVRVRIPKTAPAPVANPLTPSGRLEAPTDVPATFITAMPPLLEPDMKELEVTPINPPYAYSRITYSESRKEYLYEVIEPQLSRHERELVDHLKETLGKILGSESQTLTTNEKRAYLRGEVEEYLKTRQISLSPLSTEKKNGASRS